MDYTDQVKRMATVCVFCSKNDPAKQVPYSYSYVWKEKRSNPSAGADSNAAIIVPVCNSCYQRRLRVSEILVKVFFSLLGMGGIGILIQLVLGRWSMWMMLILVIFLICDVMLYQGLHWHDRIKIRKWLVKQKG